MPFRPTKQAEVAFRDRSVDLSEFSQRLTYKGLVEGLPTIESNQELIKSIIDDQNRLESWLPIYLVPPVEQRLEYTGTEPYEYGTPSCLPPVLCIANLTSMAGTGKGEDEDEWSRLKLVWFQDTFALPIDARIRRHLKKTDWCNHAKDYDFF